MKALIYRSFGPPGMLEWTDDWPEPTVSPGRIIVRIMAGSVNPKDVLLRKGKFSSTLAREPLPRVSGHDMVGEVAAVGAGVAGYAVGDRVFGMTNRFSGGTLAEYVDFDPDEICQVSDTLSPEEWAAMPLAALTALQALRDCGHLSAGQSVLINGASGGVGHFAVQIGKAMGVKVQAVCGPDNTDFVESLGADVVHRYTDRPANEIAGTFDAVFDAFGNYSRPRFKRQLGRDGIYVSTVPKRGTMTAEFLARVRCSQKSRLVLVRSNSADLKQLVALCDSGLLKPFVEKAFAADEAADAHRHVETRHTRGKVVILMPGVRSN